MLVMVAVVGVAVSALDRAAATAVMVVYQVAEVAVGVAPITRVGLLLLRVMGARARVVRFGSIPLLELRTIDGLTPSYVEGVQP